MPNAGRPRDARQGQPLVIAGVPVAAGVASNERRFTTRASAEELWAALDVAASPSGRDAVWDARGLADNAAAKRRFTAYLGQARSFYVASAGIDLLSRPLSAYYAVLNLAKAWLTVCDPAVTDPTPPPARPGKKRAKRKKLFHGTSDELDASKTRYRFSQERLAFQASGVFAEIAQRSGTGFFYAQKKEVALSDLAAYLCETHDEYDHAISKRPKLIPIESLSVLRGADASGDNAIWLRAELSRDVLRARNIKPTSLAAQAHHFGSVFHHVSSEQTTHSYESDPITYKGRNPTSKLPDLVKLFESSLLHTNRSAGLHRHYLVLDPLRQLLSQEAVAFAVMHHLSEMVRYRPEQVERLAGEKWSWLLGTWVPRSLENALLTYTTRTLGQEYRIH